MDIEEVAEKHPDAIISEPVDIHAGLSDAQASKLALALGLDGDLTDKAVAQFKSLYKLFIETDATQVEINPLAVGSVPGGESNLIFAVGACPLLPILQHLLCYAFFPRCRCKTWFR